MPDFTSQRSSWQSQLIGYVVAVAIVGVAITGLWLMQTHWGAAAHVSILLIAVILTTRFAGSAPGLVATAFALLGLGYLLPHLHNPLADPVIQVLRLGSFAVVGCYVVWITSADRRRTESLTRARDEARRNNAALLAENQERERTEKELRNSQQLLDQVLATLPVGVTVMNLQGDVILTNEAVKRVWGAQQYPSGTERWARSKGSWHESGKRIAPSEWASVRALSQGETSLNELIDIETYAGEAKTIQNSAAPIRNAEGQIVGAVVVNDDVTERMRAEKDLKESAERLQLLSRRLLAVQEEERRHLSRELHDEFGQLLATITMHLQAAKSNAGAAAQPRLDESIALLQRAGTEVRSLALELRPMLLETAGLDATLRRLAEQHQQRTGIPTEVAGHVGDVSGEIAIAAFRVIQEALTNVVRHAKAQHVRIELGAGDASIELTVCDDGVGFDVTRTLERASGRGNLGLLGMRERVELLGGSFEIHAQPRRGTRIRASLPLAEPVAAAARQTA
jgi:signal transduction histidine kinase